MCVCVCCTLLSVGRQQPLIWLSWVESAMDGVPSNREVVAWLGGANLLLQELNDSY